MDKWIVFKGNVHTCNLLDVVISFIYRHYTIIYLLTTYLLKRVLRCLEEICFAIYLMSYVVGAVGQRRRSLRAGAPALAVYKQPQGVHRTFQAILQSEDGRQLAAQRIAR